MILIDLEKLEKELQKKQVWQVDDLMALLAKQKQYKEAKQ